MSDLLVQLQKVRKWQACEFVHPLTCGNNSRHALLVPSIKEGKLVLTCPDCDYRQEHIPGVVLGNYVEDMESQFAKFRRG